MCSQPSHDYIILNAPSGNGIDNGGACRLITDICELGCGHDRSAEGFAVTCLHYAAQAAADAALPRAIVSEKVDTDASIHPAINLRRRQFALDVV